MITAPNRIARLGTDLGPGVLCCLLIGALSYLSNAYLFSKVSPLLWAFIYSILIANLIKLPYGLDTGINFCSTNLLRFAVVVLGLTISIVTWTSMGFIGMVQVILVVAFGLSFGLWFGGLMGLEKRMSILIAVGDQTVLAQALETRNIDVTVLDKPLSISLEKKGFRILTELAKVNIPFASTGLVFRRSFVAKKPEIVERSLRAIVRAMGYLFD